MAKRVLRLDRVTVVWEPDGLGAERCHARAVVSYACSASGDRRMEYLVSGGLNGIKGATGAYRREVEREQIQDLRDHLEVFQVNTLSYDWTGRAGWQGDESAHD